MLLLCISVPDFTSQEPFITEKGLKRIYTYTILGLLPIV